MGTPGTSERANAVVAEITGAGGTAVADSGDVSVTAQAIVRRAVDAFGGLTRIINNAGIGGHGTLDTVTEVEFDRALAIHLRGTVEMCKAAWPIFTRQTTDASLTHRLAPCSVWLGPIRTLLLRLRFSGLPAQSRTTV